MRSEEEAALAVASEPMRNYLVQHIFPTLTPALLEVAKLRPEDPIDFLVSKIIIHVLKTWETENYNFRLLFEQNVTDFDIHRF